VRALARFQDPDQSLGFGRRQGFRRREGHAVATPWRYGRSSTKVGRWRGARHIRPLRCRGRDPAGCKGFGPWGVGPLELSALKRLTSRRKRAACCGRPAPAGGTAHQRARRAPGTMGRMPPRNQAGSSLARAKRAILQKPQHGFPRGSAPPSLGLDAMLDPAWASASVRVWRCGEFDRHARGGRQ